MVCADAWSVIKQTHAAGMTTQRQTVVAIDCGSSAVRAYIAEVGPGHQWQVLESLSRDVDLTRSLRGGKLSRAAMESVIEALSDIMLAARSYQVQRVRAVATAALREASNTDVLLERVSTRLGVEVEVIDSGEEVRLYYEALRRLILQDSHSLKGSSLFIDLGSGNSVVGLIRGGKLVHAVDEHFGTDRLFSAFKQFHDQDDFAQAVDRVTQGAVTMMLERLPRGKVGQFLVTGTEVRALAQIIQPDQQGDICTLAADDIERWWQEITALTPTARAARCNCHVNESGLLLLASAFIRQIVRRGGLTEVLVPQVRLRDGIIADLLPGSAGANYLNRQQLLAAARDISKRFGMSRAYAVNTASLAAQIFDQTECLHGFAARERALLEFAALVHDIGAYINVRMRNKHSYYIIQSLDIAGLTELEKQVIAHVVRYHRRSEPKLSHSGFQSLPRSQRVLVSQLAAILRLAYALDVERTQRIKHVHCRVDDDRLLMAVDRHEIALEEWALSGKSVMFERVFGVSVQLIAQGAT